jgi:hypothetical protein
MLADSGGDPYLCSPQIARRVHVRIEDNPRRLAIIKAALHGDSSGATNIRASAPRWKVSKPAPKSGSESDLSPDHRTNAAPMATKTKSTIIPANSAIVDPTGNPINAPATPSTSNATSIGPDAPSVPLHADEHLARGAPEA